MAELNPKLSFEMKNAGCKGAGGVMVLLLSITTILDIGKLQLPEHVTTLCGCTSKLHCLAIDSQELDPVGPELFHWSIVH
ncbi:hypothetical protein SLA2020_010210 [Shorea laevis]